jgi:hypothetical protein
MGNRAEWTTSAELAVKFAGFAASNSQQPPQHRLQSSIIRPYDLLKRGLEIIR